MNDDVLSEIVSKVHAADLQNLSNTCKRFHSLCKKRLAKDTILVSIVRYNSSKICRRLHLLHSWKLSHDVISRFTCHIGSFWQSDYWMELSISISWNEKVHHYRTEIISSRSKSCGWLRASYQERRNQKLNHVRGHLSLMQNTLNLDLPSRMKQLMCPRRLIYDTDVKVWPFYYDEHPALWYYQLCRALNPEIRKVAQLGNRISILSDIDKHHGKIKELVDQAKALIRSTVPLNWMRVLYTHCDSWKDLTDDDYAHFTTHYSGANNDITLFKLLQSRPELYFSPIIAP